MSRYPHDFNNPEFTAAVDRIEHGATHSHTLVASPEVGSIITFYDEGDPPGVLEVQARVIQFDTGHRGHLLAHCAPDWSTFRRAPALRLETPND